MSSADFSFVEYSYNPATETSDIPSRLKQLGFAKRSVHRNGRVSVWNQERCIILLRETDRVSGAGLTGFGFLITDSSLPGYHATYDNDIDMWVANDQSGLSMRIILIPETEQTPDKLINENYVIVDNTAYTNPGLSHISGAVYNTVHPRTMDFFQDAGFRFTKSGERYNTLVSKNNRFSLMMNKQRQDHQVSALILDTDDVFHATTVFTVAGVELKHYDIDASKLKLGSLNHRVAGYNCLAFGNAESYTIENLIPRALPGLDFIFRSRRQYLHILESTLDRHYEDQINDPA